MSDQPNPIRQISRRRFLQLTGISGSGLILGLAAGCDRNGPYTADGAFAPNGFLRVAPDNSVTLLVHKPEVGQGVNTAFAMIIADEMDAAWRDVKVMAAPINPSLYGSQETVASRGVLISWTLLRKAGATARAMLLEAAAERLQVSASSLTTAEGQIHHAASGRTLSFGELATSAANQRKPLRYFLTLKEPEAYRLIGRSVPNIDGRNIVVGAQAFSIDQQLPNMRYATYTKSPARGASLIRAKLAQVQQMPGVLAVFAIKGNNQLEGLCPGIAVVAEDTWSALQASKALEAQWADDGCKDSWSDAQAAAMTLAGKAGSIRVAQHGHEDSQPPNAKATLNATYQYHFASHAQLEPLCCTAWLQDQQLDLWCSSQSPDQARTQAAQLAGLAPEQVHFHQLRGGGAFGRRLYHDILLEATAIAKELKAPVKLVRSREDDMHSDFHRAGGFHHLQGGLNQRHQLQLWRNHFVSFSSDGKQAVRGGSMAATEFPAPFVEQVQITQSLLPWRTPVGFCRAPGANVFAFVTQSFLHELSSHAGMDHLEFLLGLLSQPQQAAEDSREAIDTQRASRVLRRVAEMSGWGKTYPRGQGLGLAFHFSHGGYFAEVAKVQVTEAKRLQVDAVYVVGDVGRLINPSGALAQCEGAVLDGLSLLFGQKVTLEDGISQQANFDAYPVLRMAHTPSIEIDLLPSSLAPSGLGEPALPPIAPAVGNAIFAATGHRVRTLPFSEEGYHH